MNTRAPAIWTPGNWNAFFGFGDNALGHDKPGQTGVLYEGLAMLGGAAILGGLVLGAIGACVIEREFSKASAFAVAGAVLTLFGFMHRDAIGIGRTPVMALSYLLVASWLLGCARYAVTAPKPVEAYELHGALPAK